MGSIGHCIRTSYQKIGLRHNTVLVLFFLLSAISAFAQEIKLTPTANSPNVVRIITDTIYLTKGHTYRYTVDTAVDSGLVQTDLRVKDIPLQLQLSSGREFDYQAYDLMANPKFKGYLTTGDMLKISNGGGSKDYKIKVVAGALSPILVSHRQSMSQGCPGDIILDFIAGQRSPSAQIDFFVPAGINVTLDNVTVDIIGRGEVTLRELPQQSIGRGGGRYGNKKVGTVQLKKTQDGGYKISFSGIDLRPLNGIDLRLRIRSVTLDEPKDYEIYAIYTTAEPNVLKSFRTAMSTVHVRAVAGISDLKFMMPVSTKIKQLSDLDQLYSLQWTAPKDAEKLELMLSTDRGLSWRKHAVLPASIACFKIRDLQDTILYQAKLIVVGGKQHGESNRISFYAKPVATKTFGIVGNGIADDTDQINSAIDSLSRLGGGILSFEKGKFLVRTILLKNNVWLHIGKESTIRGLFGMNDPETTWFNGLAYRYGLSPTDSGPYDDPENHLTKQDVGHSYFHNAMFFAERRENIKIFGNGHISGNGHLMTGDKVMNGPSGLRADKMFVFKLCKNVEVGGFYSERDLWYDEKRDEPYYIEENGARDFMIDNVLHIDQAGHFVVLATGTDTIFVHDTYFGRANTSNARDIYDFMGCNQVSVSNIYSKLSSDDIVKLGSDCSLGFTRPSRQHAIRNIIGDTNCNLFQIGSETVDDIQDVFIDNIYVLGANKAGFSISTNDGGRVKNVFLNSGYTGKVHQRSKMLRTRTPFFISISNRGRVFGAEVKRFRFREDSTVRDELLCTNVAIGRVENIIIQEVDIREVYAGSSFRQKRWKVYDGSQEGVAAIIAGYSLPDSAAVDGGLDISLPDQRNRSYVSNISFRHIDLRVKGGFQNKNIIINPPELGVGKYNVKDFGVLPAYGYWFRHTKNIAMIDCKISTESKDERQAVVLNDVDGKVIKCLTIEAHEN